MAERTEDTIPRGYKYSWSKDSDIPLQDFLAKYKPSMVQNDGTKPWIWIRSTKDALEATDEALAAALSEARKVLKDTMDKIESIKNDDSIPLRSNKKTGAKSKKEVREQVQAGAAETFKKIAQKHGYVVGKWLIFAPHDKVDMIWLNLAGSLIDGPLAGTDVHTAKVSTSPESDDPKYQHVICLYIPDVYDKDLVTKVMKVLLRNHGATLSGVKSDLYTLLGIDSKHPSGMQSTIWKNSALMKDSEMRELKEQFYAELRAVPKTTAVPAASTSTTTAAASQAKPKLKKKGRDDPFASDDGDQEASKPAISGKRAKEGDDDEEQPQKKKAK
ncbi:hypothetical protein Moror_17739 [Moniliophthora roreri MCA 2997]|uniref:Uncharacterized protein n=2 Tax=Moniliophthora roreri TaxID=221103 RepID=V2XDP0_MONRO|nr:hypothetical protein Moror_17739 [Moniliophthora roreri MCA 2997]KAI3618968.1 hypothetical protein WG66_000548 [Moniliophthora roreri]